MTTYEELLGIVQGLQRSVSDENREITWTSGSPVGVARNPHGLIEIFLEGPPLAARYRRVRDALEYQRWYRAGGTELVANRLLLPAAGHFEQIAAFLCTELLRNGAASDLPDAFAKTEPLVDLTIKDLLIADETFVGLCGELLLLDALARAVLATHVGELVESWKGYRESARDFQLPTIGVEAKTTVGASSSHHFRGVHQFEVGHGVDGADETQLMVVSVGLEWSDEAERANSTSLPELVERLIQRVVATTGASASMIVNELLDHIAAYGGAATTGYDHRTMAESSRLSRPFRLRFCRAYDINDPTIRLLTTDDLRARPFIDAESLRLRVDFPDQVTGNINPIVGLSTAARAIASSAAWG
jgi:hypothetical protein